MNILLDPEANLEIRQAAEFYEDSRHGLGQEFLKAVESAFDQIQQHPRTRRILKGRFRRYLLQRFPYGLIYAVEGKLSSLRL
ncbi:MAG: hypothetical protein A4E19_20320 [Nitrospira sp. SG-bin1]|nr:MAG: hypothetical protein A4E19_20320 [Nitrospira sp. SG-bin1]